MSKELEMLRAMVAVDHLRGGEKFEVPKTAGQASWVWRMTHLDLRAILSRLEAAERVCESVSSFNDAPGCAWCGAVASAYISRGLGEQEGDCCGSCMAHFGHENLLVRQVYQPDMEPVRDALRAYRALDGEETQ